MSNLKFPIKLTQALVGAACPKTETCASGEESQLHVTNELSELPEAERSFENNLKNHTYGEISARIFITVFNEFLACLIFFTASLASVITGVGFQGQALATFGLVMALLAVFVRENAAHFHPHVTIIITLMGKLGLPWYFMLLHLLAQALAAILATLFAWALTPGNDRTLGLGLDVLAFGYTPGQGLFALTLGGLINMSVMIWMLGSLGEMNYYEQTGEVQKSLKPFSLVIAAAHLGTSLAFGRIAGNKFHWYLYFFPGVFSGQIDTSNWWIWFVSDLLAAVLAFGVYQLRTWIENMAGGLSHVRKVKLKKKNT